MQKEAPKRRTAVPNQNAACSKLANGVVVFAHICSRLDEAWPAGVRSGGSRATHSNHMSVPPIGWLQRPRLSTGPPKTSKTSPSIHAGNTCQLCYSPCCRELCPDPATAHRQPSNPYKQHALSSTTHDTTVPTTTTPKPNVTAHTSQGRYSTHRCSHSGRHS